MVFESLLLNFPLMIGEKGWAERLNVGEKSETVACWGLSRTLVAEVEMDVRAGGEKEAE